MFSGCLGIVSYFLNKFSKSFLKVSELPDSSMEFLNCFVPSVSSKSLKVLSGSSIGKLLQMVEAVALE